MRRAAILLTVAALAAGCGSGDDAGPSLDVEPNALAGAPGALGELYASGNELVGGGPGAFREQLETLRGTPVVVNKWASWCGPCRAEFPYFQSQALERGKQVAFIGVNSADNDGDAERFLSEYPVPYPSFRDPESKIADVFHAVAAFPSTAFYDSKGELAYLKQGGYQNEADLEADIREHAR